MKLSAKRTPWYLNWKGLLFKDIEPIVIKTRFGIHTFGLKQSIDVVVLDKNHFIRKMKHDLQPNRIFLWNPAFDTVLELPSSTIKTRELKLGQKIDLQTF